MEEKTIAELEQRKLAIASECELEGADLDKLNAEMDEINNEINRRRSLEAEAEAEAIRIAEEAKAEEEKRNAAREAVANGMGTVLKELKKEGHEMTNEEIRSSEEYKRAFADYIKTEDDTECRALLTVNTASGYVPVPTIVDDIIHTAWDRVDLMQLVKKTYLKGNVKVGFELSADPAYVHVEGAAAATEEALTLGVVDLIPKSIKKWITISDEADDLTNILDYVYDELTYRIAKKAEDDLIALITAATTTAATNKVAVAEIEDDGTTLPYTVAAALGELSDEARNPAIVMHKSTYASFRAAMMGANYAIDPFENLPVYFNNTLAPLTTATTGDCWLIVGDFGVGAQANFPNGSEIRIKYDDISLAEKDLIKLVGREYVALGLVANKAFTRVVVGA